MNSESKQRINIVLLLLLFVLFFGVISISVNRFDINKKRTDNLSSNDEICKYNLLQEPDALSDNQLKDIKTSIEKDYDFIINSESISISLVDNHIYVISYNTIQDNSNTIVSLLWSENNKWESYGVSYSDLKEEIDRLKNKICLECGNCNNNLCEYKKIYNPNDLSSFEIEKIFSVIEHKNNLKIDKKHYIIKQVNDYIYEINFETIEKSEQYKFVDIVWKENEIWNDLGVNIKYNPNDVESLKQKICEKCKTC